MTDYTPNTDFSVKDALPAEDPEKLILGLDLDDEHDDIQIAINSKYDDSDISSQAQAEAGISNAVLMTPLRVADLLGGGGAGAGIINDLIGLADPGDDRILFWDESIDAAAYLDIGTHLETTAGAVLNVTEATIDHDALLGFVADEHVDHTSVTITAGEGLTYGVGGTDISADATLEIDLDGLTIETTLDIVNDVFVFFDSSASAHRVAPIENIIGDALGDGKFYRNGNQALSAATEATVVFNAIDYSSLERGTFSLVTGEYTVGGANARIWIVANITINQMSDDHDIEIEVQVQGVTVLRSKTFNDTDNDTPQQTYTVSGPLSLSSSDVVRVRVTTSDTETILGTTRAYSYIGIMELA